VPGEYPRGFHGCEADRKFSARRKGTRRALAVLENSKCPESTPEDFMAVKQTGNSLREERVLGGRLRNWNRRNTHA